MTRPRIIAQRGSPDAYDAVLIDTGDKDEHGLRLGRVVDLIDRRVYEPRPIDVIAKFGYWYLYTGNAAADDMIA